MDYLINTQIESIGQYVHQRENLKYGRLIWSFDEDNESNNEKYVLTSSHHSIETSIRYENVKRGERPCSAGKSSFIEDMYKKVTKNIRWSFPLIAALRYLTERFL